MTTTAPDVKQKQVFFQVLTFQIPNSINLNINIETQLNLKAVEPKASLL